MNQKHRLNSSSDASNPDGSSSPALTQNPHRLLVEQMPVAVAMVDDQLRYIAVSQKWQQTLNLQEDWVGDFHHDLFLNLPQTWSEKAQRCLAGNLAQWEQSCYVSLLKGSVQWIQWKVQTWHHQTGEVGGLILMIQNAASAEIIIPDPMMMPTPEAVLWMTLEGYICYANEAACHQFGYHQLDLLQLRVDQIDPDMQPVVWQEHCQQLSRDKHVNFSAHHQRQTGELFPVSVHAQHLILNSPEPIIAWWVESAIDKKANDAAIIAYQDQLEAVLHAVPGLVSWISSDLKYLGVNQHLANTYNLPIEAFIGQSVGFWETSPEFNQFVFEFFKSEHWIDSREVETYVNQNPRVYLIHAQKYQRGSAAVFVGLDITERIKIETVLQKIKQQETCQKFTLEATLNQLYKTQLKLIQIESKSSLDHIVAGVAHEINNPVSFIYGNLFHLSGYVKDLVKIIELYQHYYPNPPAAIIDALEEIEWDYLQADLPQLLDSMKMGTERVRRVVKALCHFSHLDKEAQGTVNLEENLESTLLLLQNRLLAKGKSAGIQLVKSYSSLPYIECYPRQLNQVFFHLITYIIDQLEAEIAQHTMVCPPTLTLKTEVIDIDTVRVSISGNTTVLSTEICQQIFDPPARLSLNCISCGKIGLSIAHQLVVEQQGGELECLSQPGAGILFQVTLPRKPVPLSKHYFLF
jgi:two-component system NtrC family sensor kinase